MVFIERIRLALQRQSRVYRITWTHELSHMPKSVKVDKPVWGSKLKLSANCPSVSRIKISYSPGMWFALEI